MTLTPSQQAWANEQIGQDRSVAHTGTITKVTSKKDGWVATVEGDDKRTATFDLMGATKATADAHVGIESTVAVTGQVTEVIELNGQVGFVVTGTNGTAVEWAMPPAATEAEVEAARPAPDPNAPPPFEPAPFVEDANFKDRLLRNLADDAEFKANVKALLA